MRRQLPATSSIPWRWHPAAAAVDEAVAWLRAQPVEADKLVYATAEPAEVAAAQDTLGRERAGAVVEQALARLAQEGFALGVRRFVVAGGETSGAVTQALVQTG
jgi:uncharacterized protein YgbK (DUF1537 family)